MTAEELVQAIAEAQQNITTAITEHLQAYNVPISEAQAIGAAAADIIGTLYKLEFGEAEAAEEAPSAPDAQSESDIPDSVKQFVAKFVNKAGSTWSAENKLKIKSLYESGSAHIKALKELHDEVFTAKSAAGAAKNEITLADYVKFKNY